MSLSRLTSTLPLMTAICFAILIASASAQTGSIHEPVRYIGGPTVHHASHDGRLRPVIGAESVQVVRVNRTHPEFADGFGWTYSHAPMIAYWNGKFYVQYLSNPVGEHMSPGQTLVCTSTDGRNWDAPKVVFPIYELQSPDALGTTAMMHQRMGFFIAPNGKLLVLAFYGHAPNPFRKGGIGRVVREVNKDGTYGPIYFIRYNEQSGWNEKNTRYPFYQSSDDQGFVAACDAMLDNRLMREQWWDEEHLEEDDIAAAAQIQHEAFNWYHRKDGKVVGLWKWSLSALSSDEGKTWSPLVKVPTLQMTGAKVSGRRTSDDRFALVYNPTINNDHRWPLIIVTGDDGILFDNMLCIQGEVPPRRFHGKWKDFGPQYNRIVEEGNGNTPGSDLWVTYSMNKEDIWVTRVPVPVRHQIQGPVINTFDGLATGGPITDWNTYSPRWAKVSVVNFPSAENKSIELQDQDPYDYARAIRVFTETKAASIQFRVHPKQTQDGCLEVDVTDQFGFRPIRMAFAADGNITIFNGGEQTVLMPYQPDKWYDVEIKADVASGHFDVTIDGKSFASQFSFTEHVKSIERLSFRTGAYRAEPNLRTPTEAEIDLTSPNPDLPEAMAIFHIDDVKVEP